MRLLLLTAILLTSLHLYAQSYSYRFSGMLTDEQQTQFLSKVEVLNFFSEVKIRYKSDLQKGELLFTIPPKPAPTEEELPYSVLTIKDLLIKSDLTPDQYVEKPRN